ncbi:MAG: ion transporter [Cytophagales bacterium]|nr:MAG: ion transporter [Cytophagales bacterium]TAH28834.1 MAG: ion transporter [Cytophagales bacterium]
MSITLVEEKNNSDIKEESTKQLKENKQIPTKNKKLYFTLAREFVKKKNWQYKLYLVLYHSKVFSGILLALIFLSSMAVVLQTVDELHAKYSMQFRFAESFITILFTIEYILRCIATPHFKRYMFSKMGYVDFLALLPFYFDMLGIFNVNFLLVMRLIRLFRLVRVFDLLEYSLYHRELMVLTQALRNSRRKISLFIISILISVTLLGTIMYLVEGKENGFVSIPKGIYWAVVTISTVGYGDVTPKTLPGQMIASALMLLGFSTIVVFTSIVGAEIYNQGNDKKKIIVDKECLDCGLDEHDNDAHYCKQCGGRLWDA